MDPIVMLVMAAAAAAAGYLATCAMFPFAACRKCHGDGKFRSPFSRSTWRSCRSCKGTGRRLRTGRIILNRIRSTHHRGTR